MPLALAAVALVVSSCAAPPPVPAPSSGERVSAHGYALLYDLLGDEKNVSKLLIVKRERDDFEAVIDAISEVAGDAYDRLGAFGETNPSLNLSDDGLPLAERAAREAIADAKTNTLLDASSEEFEIQLALAQNEALGYLTGLTQVMASAEPDPARLAFLRALWKDSTQLRERLLALIRSRYRQPAERN